MSITKTREVFSLPNVHYAEIHPSINVRAKIIFYLNEQILDTFYLGMFYIYCQNGIYEVNEEFRNMINAIIKKSGKLPMY